VATMVPDARNRPPTAQTGRLGVGGQTTPLQPFPVVEEEDKEESEWLDKARSAFYASTSYVDANYRKAWEDNIRAFNNQHPTDSKYTQPAYEKRSRVYRPKTRAVIRKNEAAAAAAYFSNMDAVTITPTDQSNKTEVASAEIMKQLLQYRLTKTIPWYQVLLGGFQDAQAVGVVCAHVYWQYEERDGGGGGDEKEEEETAAPATVDEEYPAQTSVPSGAVVVGLQGALMEGIPPTGLPAGGGDAAPPPAAPKASIDRPVVDIIPVENLRIDAGASWIDPVNTSPYLIHLMPMYVLDVKERMARGEWRKLSDNAISAATELKLDTTRVARNKNRGDPYDNDVASSIEDYSTVWVQRHIHRRGSTDWEFYTMGDVAMRSPYCANWFC